MNNFNVDFLMKPSIHLSYEKHGRQMCALAAIERMKRWEGAINHCWYEFIFINNFVSVFTKINWPYARRNGMKRVRVCYCYRWRQLNCMQQLSSTLTSVGWKETLNKFYIYFLNWFCMFISWCCADYLFICFMFVNWRWLLVTVWYRLPNEFKGFSTFRCIT